MTNDITKYLQDLMLRLNWIRVPKQVIHGLFGPKILNEYRINEEKVWSLPSSGETNFSRTSASDSPAYTDVCDAASQDQETFSKFKSERNYKSILEHTGYNNGRRYLRVLKKRGVRLPDEFLSFHSSLGNPERFSFNGLGPISPSLLRYFKVASDLDLHFPKWREQDIVEVGVGYGGQIAVLKELGHKGNYTGIDLQSVARLASKYLTTSGKYSNYSFRSSEGAEPALKGHHFISNYAFSELGPEIQERYFYEFVSSSASGYVSWNDFSEKALGGMTAETFRRSVGGQLVPEEPQTYPNNCIILWGHSS
jgi:hypothetical protein